ncbi:PrsW family intramembrane metalloprotease [Enterococcus faecalis]|uniref:PrsW family glutamic-type intramembrane protease n=1 Tax=Enterococcus TaxID=1350 RepID=UPI001A95F796|nr:PrsW family glutamic-type intramembrane protease [Enterococcus faecalis]MBO1126630.1 PrsW family intramembrane metalloprotease [Enterococcus faecalis]
MSKTTGNFRKYGSVVLLFLLFLGIEYEFDTLSLLEISSSQFFELLKIISFLLIYIVPFIVILLLLFKRWSQRRYFIPLTIGIGYFCIGWLTGWINEETSSLLIRATGNNQIVKEWVDALVPPVIEESIKIICVLQVMCSLNLYKSSLRVYFLIGACIGLGFQISEDISYIINTAAENWHDTISQALSRISGSGTSHWLYTAILSVGIGNIKFTNNLSKRTTIICLMCPFLLHFIWNSPLNNSYISSALISSVSAYVAFTIFKLLDD